MIGLWSIQSSVKFVGCSRDARWEEHGRSLGEQAVAVEQGKACRHGEGRLRQLGLMRGMNAGLEGREVCQRGMNY